MITKKRTPTMRKLAVLSNSSPGTIAPAEFKIRIARTDMAISPSHMRRVLMSQNLVAPTDN
jgi:hypothetical protein